MVLQIQRLESLVTGLGEAHGLNPLAGQDQDLGIARFSDWRMEGAEKADYKLYHNGGRLRGCYWGRLEGLDIRVAFDSLEQAVSDDSRDNLCQELFLY